VNDEDLRDLFAAFAMLTLGTGGTATSDARDCYRMADAMIEAKYAEEEPEVGITAVKRKYTRKSNEDHSTES